MLELERGDKKQRRGLRRQTEGGKRQRVGPRLPTEELRNLNKGEKNTVSLSLHRIRDSADVMRTLVSPWMLAVAPSMLVGVLRCPIFLSFSISLSGDPNCLLVYSIYQH